MWRKLNKYNKFSKGYSMKTMNINKQGLNYDNYSINGSYLIIEISDDYFIETKVISKIMDRQIRFYEKYQDFSRKIKS